MAERIIPELIYDSTTKNNILNEATKLFAIKGYSAVSMKDIARATGIKTGSIYNHYDGKESLLNDIVLRFEKGYRNYFDWLKEKNKIANSLDELMDNMFNDEFLNMQDPLGILGISLALKEQHNNEYIRERVFDLFFNHSIQSLQEDFDRLIEKGVIPSSDTKTIATSFMFSVMVCNDIRIHEYMGIKPPLDCAHFYKDLRNLLTTMLLQGTIVPGT